MSSHCGHVANHIRRQKTKYPPATHTQVALCAYILLTHKLKGWIWPDVQWNDHKCNVTLTYYTTTLLTVPAACWPSPRKVFWPLGCWGPRSNPQCQSAPRWTSDYGTHLLERHDIHRREAESSFSPRPQWAMCCLSREKGFPVCKKINQPKLMKHWSDCSYQPKLMKHWSDCSYQPKYIKLWSDCKSLRGL